MGCAAIGASFASVLPLQPSASLAVILTTGSALALLVFLPVALRRPEAEMGGAGGEDRRRVPPLAEGSDEPAGATVRRAP
jgi:hypothetical protein